MVFWTSWETFVSMYAWWICAVLLLTLLFGSQSSAEP